MKFKDALKITFSPVKSLINLFPRRIRPFLHYYWFIFKFPAYIGIVVGAFANSILNGPTNVPLTVDSMKSDLRTGFNNAKSDAQDARNLFAYFVWDLLSGSIHKNQNFETIANDAVDVLFAGPVKYGYASGGAIGYAIGHVLKRGVEIFPSDSSDIVLDKSPKRKTDSASSDNKTANVYHLASSQVTAAFAPNPVTAYQQNRALAQFLKFDRA